MTGSMPSSVAGVQLVHRSAAGVQIVHRYVAGVLLVNRSPLDDDGLVVVC